MNLELIEKMERTFNGALPLIVPFNMEKFFVDFRGDSINILDGFDPVDYSRALTGFIDGVKQGPRYESQINAAIDCQSSACITGHVMLVGDVKLPNEVQSLGELTRIAGEALGFEGNDLRYFNAACMHASYWESAFGVIQNFSINQVTETHAANLFRNIRLSGRVPESYLDVPRFYK